MKNFRTILIFLAGLLTGFVFSMAFLPSYLSERTPKDGEEGTASMMVDSGEKIVICKGEPTEETTVFNFLETCSEEQDFELSFTVYEGMGVLVESIDGQSADSQKYWQYWVNNEYAQVSADNFKVIEGDAILWKLTGLVSD